MAVTCVYWIRCADHTDLMTQGYIGAGNRWHFDNCKLNLPTVFTASAVDFERTASCQ